MIKLKYQLATLATAALASQAYAQPVVPDDTGTPSQAPTCPAPAGATGPSCPAQPLQQPGAYQPPPAPPPQPVAQETPWWNNQFAISVGGGVDDFARSNAKAETSMGGSWNARLTMGVHSYIAGEISYIGSAQTLNQVGLSQTLYGNGAQGAIRINILPNLDVTPFAYGGAAWRYYNTSGGNFGNTSEGKLEVPAGAGIAAYVADMMFDVRGEYRFAPNSENSHEPVGVEAISGSFDRWGVTGNIGAVF